MAFKTSLICLTLTSLLVEANGFFISETTPQRSTDKSLIKIDRGTCKDLKGNLFLNFTNVGLQHVVSDFIDSSTVQCLSLENNKIDYVSSAAFRLMPNLMFVNLGRNKLSFFNFSHINSHKQLRTLILDENHCFFGMNRIIEFKNVFPNLLYLYLRGNDLEDIPSLAFAPKLAYLYLSSNNLSGSKLSFLEDVSTTLITLNLADNDIHNLSVSGLVSVQELTLDGNRIERLCGKSYCRDSALILKGASKLQRLSLARNGLTSVEPDAFDDAENLLELDLSFNRLDNIRKSTFERVEILRKLLLNNNLLSDMPDLCGPESLQYLSLSNNRLEVVKSDSFCLIDKLKLVDLSNNRIRLIEDGAFANLRSLEMLDLSNNRLVKLPSRWLNPLVNLRLLYMDGNRLRQLKDIELGSVRIDAKLTHVYLRNNFVTTFHSSSLFNTLRIVPNITLEFHEITFPNVLSNDCDCDCDENNEISWYF